MEEFKSPEPLKLPPPTYSLRPPVRKVLSPEPETESDDDDDEVPLRSESQASTEVDAPYSLPTQETLTQHLPDLPMSSSASEVSIPSFLSERSRARNQPTSRPSIASMFRAPIMRSGSFIDLASSSSSAPTTPRHHVSPPLSPMNMSPAPAPAPIPSMGELKRHANEAFVTLTDLAKVWLQKEKK